MTDKLILTVCKLGGGYFMPKESLKAFMLRL